MTGATVKCTVFYSWESDLPNPLNRGFIEKALENAARAIRADDSIQVEPVVDRDTLGVPGAPDISSAILAKIAAAQVVVCDVSILERQASRPAPNPNVLIELGYAMRALGPERVLLVMNAAFGGPELLPFDLRTRRVVLYTLDEKAADRTAERKKLESHLELGIRTILEGLERELPGEPVQPAPLVEQARSAVLASHPSQGPLVRRYMASIADDLDARARPVAAEEPVTPQYDALRVAIDGTVDLLGAFTQLADAIAAMNSSEAATAVFKGFDGIIRGYYLRRDQGGSFHESDFDFHKFMGHELFVCLFAPLIREQRWDLVGNLLEENIFWERANSGQGGMVSYGIVSREMRLLAVMSQQTKRASVRADILQRRHTEGILAQLVPLEQFLAADYFLWLRSEIGDARIDPRWRAWSRVYLRELPRWLLEATHRRSAERVLEPLGVPSIEAFRERLLEVKTNLRGDEDGPLEYFDPTQIGSR